MYRPNIAAVLTLVLAFTQNVRANQHPFKSSHQSDDAAIEAGEVGAAMQNGLPGQSLVPCADWPG